MVVETENSPSPTLDDSNLRVDVVKKLMEQRTIIENEIDSIGEELSSESFLQIGLKKPLVDAEGFPLAGLDIHRVRELRNRYAILQTDVDNLTESIERALHDIHEHARITGSITSGVRRPAVPFGRVETVVSGSAAEHAGLLVGDKIVKFGHLCCYSSDGVQQCYESIPEVVRGSQDNQILSLEVTRLGRPGETIELNLRPRDGRIGCLIKPL
jgi:26S proteasome non-ATPase regulatory subunit 9